MKNFETFVAKLFALSCSVFFLILLALCISWVLDRKNTLPDSSLDLKSYHEALVESIDDSLDDFSCIGRRLVPGRDKVLKETIAVVCSRVDTNIQTRMFGWEDSETTDSVQEEE